MPKWYRLNGSGSWIPTNSIYRLNASGAWTKVKTIYRLNASGVWDDVHSSVSVPTATTPPTLTNQVSSTTNFFGGDTLTLTRGEYTETTTNSDTTYRMRIYKGTDISKPLSDTTAWTAVTTDNFTGSNSTSSTTITYALTDADAKAGNYLVGEVRVNNDANTAGSATYDFETTKVLSKISFTVGALTVTPTHRGGSFSWSVNGINDDSTFIHSQTLTVRLTNSTGEIKVTQSPATTSRNSTVEDSINISPSTMYYATIEVVANDGWKNTATPNKLTSNVTFNTLSAPPVNTVAPTIGPLNNRGYLPVSTVLTSTQGTWSNVSAGTTYLFDWWKEDSVTNLTTNTGYITNSTQTYSVNDVGDYVFVRVKATNSDGGEGTATSTTYTLDQAVAVGNITPTTTTVNVATNFSFNISHYPTSYVVNWGDGTTDSENIAANTSTVNKTISHTYTSTGTKTVTITAQPGNKTSTTNITVAVPTPTATNIAQSNGTTIPSQPSTITFSSSNNQVTSSWTNGSPITSVTFKGIGAGVNTEYTDTTSPFITSDVSNFSSTGTYTATVTNTNGTLVARVSWNQANAASYRIDFDRSNTGSDVVTNNSSASSVSVDIPWTTLDGTFRVTALTLYSGANQTGVSASYSPGFSAIPIQAQSSTRTNSTSLTYTPPPTLDTPTFGTVTRAVGGFSVGISNYDANNFYNVTASSGTASRSGATITVTGLTAGASSTVSVVASRSGYTNSATGQVTGTAANTPSAPQSLSRSGTGLSKTFTWSAPADNNGSAITSYEYSVNGGSSWAPTSSSTSQSYTYSLAGSVSFSVRAVNGVGGGTAASVTFTIPSVSSVTASSITSTGATISWTSSGQSSYSLTGVGPNSPYTGTTATSRAVTGLTAATAYTPTVTVTSSTGDTASASGSFSTTGGNVAPSGGTYTFNPAAPPASGAVSLTITNVSGTPSTFTYSFVWRRATTSGIGNGTGTDRTYQTTALKTTTNISNNFDSLSILSTYNNFWVRVETTVSNGVTPNLTSMRYVYISNAN